jgi:hypothetical protein
VRRRRGLYCRLVRRYGKWAAALVGLAAFTAPLAGPASALANTITVTSAADPGDGTTCTLAQAIASADADTAGSSTCLPGSGDDTIVFAPTVTGPITLASTLVIDPIVPGTLRIQGPGADMLAVSGNNLVRVVDVHVAADAAHAVTISGLTITQGKDRVNGPSPSPAGGGVKNSGTLTLDHVDVTSNTATAISTDATIATSDSRGGGIFNENGHLTLTHSTVEDNATFSSAFASSDDTVTAQGAGLYSHGVNATVHISDSTITGNSTVVNAVGGTTTSAISVGAGLTVLGGTGAALQITRTTIDNNTGNTTSNGSVTATESGIGGGVAVSMEGSIASSTIADNVASQSGTAATSGGGIYFVMPDVVLASDTITGNDALDGANLYQQTGSVEVENTIVSEPVGGTANCDLAAGTYTSNGHNLFDDATCPHGSVGDVFDSLNINLLSLGNYGGPTQTRLPGPNSSAIDQGVAASQSTDQRGLQRTWEFDTPDGTGGDGTDIGAVEVQGPTVLSTNPVSPSTDQSPHVIGTAEPGSTVELRGTSDCSGSPIGTGSNAIFAGSGIQPSSPLALGTTVVFHATSLYGTARSACSPTSVSYTVPATPPAPPPPAKKKCKKKAKKRAAHFAKKKKCRAKKK